MADICQNIPVIPQNFGSCWFNSILTCCLYSDRLSAIIFQKAIEDNWIESGKLIKVYMYNLLSYLYAIKNGRKDLIKSLNVYISKYNIDMILISYAKDFHPELLIQIPELLEKGYEPYYINLFLEKLGVTKENYEIIRLSNSSKQVYKGNMTLDCILLENFNETDKGNHIISAITCNSRYYIYNGWYRNDYKQACNLILFDWTRDVKNFYFDFDKCIFKYDVTGDDLMFSFGKGKRIYIYTNNISIGDDFVFKGIKHINTSNFKSYAPNMSDYNKDDLINLLRQMKIHYDKGMNEEELKELILNNYFKSINISDERNILSIEQKNVEAISLIDDKKKKKLIILSIDNIINFHKKINDYESENEKFINIHQKILEMDDTQNIDEYYLKLRELKKKIITTFNQIYFDSEYKNCEYFSDMLEFLLDIELEEDEIKFLNDIIDNFFYT